jgi:hypothetical protein
LAPFLFVLSAPKANRKTPDKLMRFNLTGHSHLTPGRVARQNASKFSVYTPAVLLYSKLVSP